ncbi:MAG: UDP-N-acetylmuramoylalanine--D-glutamate ligase [Clostridiales bacterium GWF2_36_10]|nr:MAG: UDP-N-acetylmuramoylalanine--D-glutamate ligase [Clostridiales bacterium GWF2_36_10]HAN21941.1 UDP-N-acetylmuramoyl-L-alanine--D-glutamate ligase [Clostridiales bacterium]
MKHLLDKYTESFIGKKVGFIGCGVSNMPIVEMLTKKGVALSVRDKKENFDNIEQLKELDVKIINGIGYLDNIYEDILFLSPAVRDDLPELVKAKNNGTIITTEMEEFFKLCKAKTIAVTGSDGKSTTTTLISEILKASGKRVHIGGNIGKNLLATLDEIQESDIVVAELSSFQLMKMTVSPDIAIVTNVTPNHLDWHKDMDEYIKAKTNIFNFQKKDGILILNYDDKITRGFAPRANGSVHFISGEEKLPDSIYFNEKGIYKGEELLLADEDIFLVGRHNRYNYASALAATEGFATEEGILKVARSFGGVEHRLEFVRELDGVKYYNSSMDSSPSRTKACLESFKNKVIVICGGYDKNIPLEPLGPLFNEKAKAAILLGATADKIEVILKNIGYNNYYRVNTLDEAVKKANGLAESGDCVVLSPAAASFDLFKNFAERGNLFKDLVKKL